MTVNKLREIVDGMEFRIQRFQAILDRQLAIRNTIIESGGNATTIDNVISIGKEQLALANGKLEQHKAALAANIENEQIQEGYEQLKREMRQFNDEEDNAGFAEQMLMDAQEQAAKKK